MFTPYIEQDSGQPATPLWLVDEDSLALWRDGREARQVAWVAAQGFKGKAGDMLLLPAADGQCAGVLAGVPRGDTLGPWDLAPAAGRLPAGRYRLLPDGRRRLGEGRLGWLLAHYRFDRYRSEAAATEPRVLVTGDDATANLEACRQAAAVALVRDLVNTPAGDMGPAALADAARQLAARHGAEMHETIGDALLAEGFPTIHMVGRAAADAPRLIDIRWGNPDHPKVTLVGKGVCFDSGGLDIKPASGMLLMKKDMGGAAHALALAQMVMDARLPVRLRVLVPAVENSIAGNAFRPGDVVRTRKGLTVEIGNTDAEGRLVLADALALACEDPPDLLLDFATLTGAARVALGPDLPALFTPDTALATELTAHADAVNDPLWRLPLWDGYRDMLASTVADINNSSESGFAGAITAALFLQRFVASPVTWAHFDLYAWNGSAKPGRPKGGEAMTLRACWALLSARFIAK